MAVTGVGMVGMMMFFGIVFLFAAGTMVVPMFGTAGKLLEQQLNEETYHDRGGDLKVDAGCHKTERILT